MTTPEEANEVRAIPLEGNYRPSTRPDHAKRSATILFLLTLAICGTTGAQVPPNVLNVATARQDHNEVGSKEVTVRGHFWWGKEGSMIYDSYFKAVLTLRYTEAFNDRHPKYLTEALATRKSNYVTITGHLSSDSLGHLNLNADDIRFESPPGSRH